MHRYESRDQALGNQHNKTEASEEADGAPKVENSLRCLPTVQSSRHLKHSYLFSVKLSLHKKLLALYHKESEPEPPDCDEICVSVMSVLYLKWTVLLELKVRVQAFCTSHLF